MAATDELSMSVFPAYAGMSPSARRRARTLRRFPRLRGDEPFAAYADGGIWGFSPPTRG